MSKKQNELWCPTCKGYPSKIIELYSGPLEENRVWDGECFVLIDSNLWDMEYINICQKCRTELIEK